MTEPLTLDQIEKIRADFDEATLAHNTTRERVIVTEGKDIDAIEAYSEACTAYYDVHGQIADAIPELLEAAITALRKVQRYEGTFFDSPFDEEADNG